MDVISNNLANANTTRTPEGGAYHRRYVVFTPREYSERGFGSFMANALRKDRKNRDTGNGVRAVRIETDRTPSGRERGGLFGTPERQRRGGDGRSDLGIPCLRGECYGHQRCEEHGVEGIGNRQIDRDMT